MPLILLPVFGVAALALWFIESRKPKTPQVAAAVQPAAAAPPATALSLAHLVPLHMLPAAAVSAALQPPPASNPQAQQEAAALAICHAQWLLARIQAGAMGNQPLPTDLATCRAQLAVWQGIAQARAALAQATQSQPQPQPSSSGAFSFGASAQVTSGVGTSNLATQAVLAALATRGQMTGHGGHGHGGHGHGGGGWWLGSPSPLQIVDTVDDGAQVCSWAITAADSKTIRGLMGRYATRPDLVACLSQRLSQIEPMGL